MRKSTSFIGYLGGLIALMIALAACSGGGGSPTPASTPEPTAEETTVVAMLPTEEPTSQASPIPGQRRGDVDTDGDGVFDDVDQCITDGDYGYGIDEFGCPNDTDKDGFADHTDQCPDEADLGLGIDAVGCPIRDTDNDGFTDDVDSCPTEGDLGLGIDAVGCPILDTDGDGITDDVDSCYREGDIFGFGVYPDGCPIDDLDGDGYPDNVDACPSATDMGFGMSEDGCPIGDADNDGVGDNVDACQTEGDLGYGVDVEGCPNPEPTPDPEPNGDGDGDGVLNIADACPGEGGIVDALGCPLDSDTDGVVDNDDLCPTEGDLGFGVDATGCPNPNPEITPIVVDARPTINMGISATCQTTDSGVVAVFELTNPNQIEINHGYTDQNGVGGVANVAPNSTANVTIIPNNDGYARIQFDNVTNFAEITCEMPQPTPEATDAPPVLLPTLSIRNEVCITQGNPRMVIDIFNAGPGVLPAGTQFITTNNSQFILDMDVAPNSGYSMAVFVMNGFGSLQIPAYNFSYANTVACPPPPPTPEVTPPTELAPRMVVAGETCTQNNSGNPVIILSLRNDGTAPLPTGTEFLINTDSPYTLDRDIAVGESLNMTVFMRDGFGTFRIPSLNFYYTNLNPCPVGSASPDTVRIRVLETTCSAGASQYQLRIINDGPGAIAAGTEIIFTRYLSNGNNPTSTTNFGANVVAGADTRITVFVGDLGIAQVSIPAYNFSFTNDVPCTNNAVTGLQLVSATCEPGPNFAPNYPGVRFVLRNFGPNPIPAGLAYTLEGYNNEPGTTGVEIPVGGDFVTGVLMRNSGFARLVIPSLNINVQNPIQCIPPATNLSVSNYTCSFNNRGDAVVSYVITNTGPNLVSGVNVMNIVGLETNSTEIRNAIGGDLPVNGTININTRPDGNGYVTTSIPIFGFNISNPTPCPPPLPTVSVSAQCVGEYQGVISIALAGFDTFAMSDLSMFRDGVPFPYEIRFDDNSVITATTAIYADGTYTIPYTSANSWRGRQVGFIYDSVRNLIGADNSTDSLVLPLCVPDHVDYSVSISQSCDAQTGINTVTLTATNVISLNRALTFLGANSEDIRHYYQFIGTGLAPLNEQYHVSEGVAVYQLNTAGKDALSVSYFNPILVNYNAQRQLGILVARQSVDEYLSVPLELCSNPETPVQIPPSLAIISATCVSDFVGEIEISFGNFNNYKREDGTEPFLGGFNYRYQIRDDDQTLIDATQLYDDGTYIITFTAQPDWRGRTLYFDYQTAQSVVEGTVALTTHPVPLPDCLPQLPPDFGINISQSCNPDTGINTVTFTPINFASYQELFILANADPSGAGLDQYMVGTNRGIQYFTITADPVTVDVDTNGATIAAVGYPNPDMINYYVRYFILGAENAGPQPTPMDPLVQIPIDTCGVPPEPIELGEVKALEPTFTCDSISQELVIDFGLLTPAELQTVLASFLQSSGGGMSAETGLMMFAIVQGSFVPINYFIHSGEYNPNGTFIQSGIHSPLDSGDLTLRVAYNLLAGGNTFLTYIDFQPLLSYMLDVFEAQLKGENPDNIPQPDFNTVIVTVPLQDCNIPEVVAISGVCTVFNNDRVVMFDVTGFTSNLANYSVNTPNSFLLMGNPPTVIVYPDSNGYANIRIGNIGFGEITCAPDIEVTPEPETTPEAPTALALPTAPTFSVDSITCANTSGLSVQITQGDVTAYGQQFDALLRQLVPEGTLPFTFFNIYNTLGGFNGVPIILSHTAPVNMAQIDTSIVWVGGSADGVTLSNGTQTFTVALSSALSVPSNTSFYITVLSAEKAGSYLNSLVQPLVDRYNNGETITLSDLSNINPTGNQASLIEMATYAQQLDSQLVIDCLYANQPNLRISVSQVCNAETGINTISFTITGADAILATLQAANASTNLLMLGYNVGVQQGTLEFRDGTQTAQVNTAGMLVEQLNYTNPAFINEMANMLLSGGGIANAQAFISTPLTICRGNVDGVTIPQAPSVGVSGVTCPNLPQIEIALNFGDTQAYLSAVDALFAPLSNTGAQLMSASEMFNTIANSITFPVLVTHSIPFSADMLGAPSLPPNAVGASAGAIGTAQTVTVNVIQLPPANTTLYLTLVNPYLLYDILVQSLAPLVGRINNGEIVTADEVNAVLSSFDALLNDHGTHYASLLQSVAFDGGDCVGTLPEFSFSISESCNTETGVNTITFTLGGTGALAQFMPYLPVKINGFSYDLVIQDGAQTIEIDTDGLQALEVEYTNPEYIQLSLIQQMTGSLPEGVTVLPEQYLTAELSLCVTTNQLTLPEPPSFSVDSITCEAVGALTITYTNGDLGAYGMALSAVLTQILPQGSQLPTDFISAFSSLASMPIVITHTSPVSTSGISTNYIVAVSMSSVTINSGTYTLSFPLAPTGGGMPGMPLGTIPDGAPLYLNMISPRQIGIIMNNLFQPLVDMYNNGETITEETLFNMFSESTGSQALLLSLFYSQQLEQSLIDTCFTTLQPNLQIEVTEQCDAETGINTISFNITGANALSSLLGSSSFPLLVVLNGEQKTLVFQDGVQTMTLDTNGLYVASLQYLNPEYINDALGRALAGGSTSSNLPMMVTRILTLCGDTAGDDLTIPELPTPTITSLTCPTPNQLSVTINFGDAEAYANAVEALIGAVIGSLGMGNIPFDIDSVLATFGSMAQNVPVIITHTTPLDASVFMLGSMPSNVVGFSSGTATSNGTSTTYTINIIVPPPAGVPLYISYFSQYGFLERIVDAFVPLVERLKNGEQLSMTDIQNALTSSLSFGGDMQNALASMIVSQEIPSDLLEDCITPSVPFSLSISEQCDYGTGINTISITLGGTSTLATFFSGQPLPFIINGGQYNLSFQDGTQTIEFNTTGLESVQLQYVNPDYLNEMLQAILSQQTPNSQQPPLLTRDLTICVGSPTPEVTPTEEITPIVTPTEEFTPEATPTMEVTPDATPTEQITPDATPTAEVTPSPEVTPIVTLEIPTLPTLPTLPPLPTIEPTPDAPTPFCGATFEIGGQIVIDMTSAGCGIQEERPVQNWTPITIGGAVCLPEIIYHTDETGDWELFWASANRAPENLSNGVGFIDLAPTRSPDGLWIAFSSNRDGNWEIYAATVDGSTVIRLTDNDSAVDFDPSWSPDGTKLVYESNVDGNWELRMINLLTGEKTRLTNHPAPDINPAWHPNGTTIAFQSSREDGLWQIYEYSLVTGTLIRLSDGSADDTNPQYRPDGGTILYQSADSNGEISLRIMDGQGNPLMNVPVMGSRITNAIWSPDGMYIAYQATPEIGFTTLYGYEIATGETRQITSNGNAFSPAWICDTTNLVFTSNVLGDNNLYVVNALPMSGEPVDLAIVDPAIGGDANQRDPQNSPAEEDASRGGNLPPK